MRSIMGLVRSKSGNIDFMDEEITKKQPFNIARLGVGYAPSERRLFGTLTVGQNMEIAEKIPNEHSIARVTEDIPQFVGMDMKTYSLRKDDVVTLSEEMKTPLLKRKVIEPIE